MQTIEWPEQEPRIVKLFQVWLYSGSVRGELEAAGREWATLVDLYIFAEAYDIKALKNHAVDTLTDIKGIDTETFRLVYENLPPYDLLRKLLVDLFVCGCELKKHDWFGGQQHDYPKDFLFDVILALHDRSFAQARLLPAGGFEEKRTQYYSTEASSRWDLENALKELRIDDEHIDQG